MDDGSRLIGGRRERPTGSRLNSAIVNAVVQLHSRYAGRGPTRAQAFARHNVVVLLMEDAMTQGERSLAAHGRQAVTLDIRRQLETAMRERLVGAVEDLTGCRVVAFMNDNHIDPDVVAELFVLDRPVPGAQLAPNGG
jgi:uncharacterized protein YbcI